MASADEMLIAAVAAIDAANARDPNTVEEGGERAAAELVYGQRMSEVLSRMAPAASPHLKLAVRGQHIERWTSPRKSYPEGRAGYLQWRQDLKAFHARRVGEIMLAAGYGADDIAPWRDRETRVLRSPISLLPFSRLIRIPSSTVR